MQKVSQYNVPAAGSAPFIVRCTELSSKMLIQELQSPGGNPQGLIVNELKAKPFGQYDVGPAQLVDTSGQYEFSGYPGDHPPNTVPIGNGGSGGKPIGPGGPAGLGTPIAQVTSQTATATAIVVTEWI